MAATAVNRIEEPPHQLAHRGQAAIDLDGRRLVIEHTSQAAEARVPRLTRNPAA